MAKRLHSNTMRGGEGQSLIAGAFEKIGLPFHPFVGGYDAGIDGMIELRDPATGIMSNVHLGVQCKATATLHNETDASFEYRFTQDDLNYWSGGTTPVLLCVAHTPSGQVWWKSVRKEVASPTTRKSRLVRFDKQADRLDEAAVEAVLGIAHAAGAGTYLRPPPKREVLHSNLLEVTRFPPCVWRAETPCRDGGELMEALKRHEEWAEPEWFLLDGALYAAHDLHDEPWSAVCDVGTVEAFDPSDWSDSDDREERRRFVRLLNQCLRSKLGAMHSRQGLFLPWNLHQQPFDTPFVICEGASDTVACLDLAHRCQAEHDAPALPWRAIGRPNWACGGEELLKLVRLLHPDADARVAVMADNEAAGDGRRGARELADLLRPYCRYVQVLVPREAKDLRERVVAGLTPAAFAASIEA